MPRSENSICLLARLSNTSIILHTSGLSPPRRNFIFCHSQRLVTKALKSHYLLALQLPQHSPLVLRGHQIAGIVLALDPCLLEALSCKPTNKQLKMLFNSGSSSNVISCTERGGGQKASQRPILECSRKLKQRWRQQERQKKVLGLLRKTTTLHMHHAFFYISSPSLYDYDVKRFVEGVNTR